MLGSLLVSGMVIMWLAGFIVGYALGHMAELRYIQSLTKVQAKVKISDLYPERRDD